MGRERLATRLPADADVVVLAAAAQVAIEGPFHGVAVQSRVAAARAIDGQDLWLLYLSMSRHLDQYDRTVPGEVVILPPGSHTASAAADARP